MSIDNLSSFMEAIANSDSLAGEACRSMDGSNDPSAFVALGKTHGFEFTTEQVVSHFESLDGDEANGGSENGGYSQLATGVSMFGRMGRLNMVPSWAYRLYNFSTQEDMRLW